MAFSVTLPSPPAKSTHEAARQSVPLYSVHPDQHAVFVTLTAKHLPGTRNSATRQLADAYAALHGLYRRSPQRTTRRGREGDWLRISMNQLAVAMGATHATARRRVSQLRQLGLITYARLGYGAIDWFLCVHDLPADTPKSIAPQPRAQNELHMERKMSAPSYMSQKKTNQRGGESSIKTNSPQHQGTSSAHQIPSELIPLADEAFNALKANGMWLGRARFDQVISSTAGFTSGEVRQALINITNNPLPTITPDLWVKQLRLTQNSGPVLKPYVRDEKRKFAGEGARSVGTALQQQQPQPLSTDHLLKPDLPAETREPKGRTNAIPVLVNGQPGWLCPSGVFNKGSGTLLVDPQGVSRYVPVNQISSALQGHTEPSQGVPQPALASA